MAIDDAFKAALGESTSWSLLTRAETKLIPGTKVVFISPVPPATPNSLTVQQTATTRRVFVGQQEIVPKDIQVRRAMVNETEYDIEVYEIQKGVSVDIGVENVTTKFTGADERKLDGSLGILLVRSEDKTNIGLTTNALSFPLFKGDWSINTVALFSDPDPKAATEDNPKVTLGQALTYKIVLGPKWNDYESERSFFRGQIALSLSVGLNGLDVSNIRSLKSFDTKPFFGVGIMIKF